MERFSVANSFSIKVIWLHQAGSRVFAEKMEMMPLSVVGNEINCSESFIVFFDTCMIDTLVVPKLPQHLAIRVIADRAEVSNSRSLSSCSNSKVRGVSTETLKEYPARLLARLIKFDHGSPKATSSGQLTSDSAILSQTF